MSALRGPRRLRTRALLAGATAAALVVGVVGPARSQEVTGTGTSALALLPADLSVEGLPPPVAASLGALVAEATNVEGGLAGLSLEGIGAAGQTAPGFDVSSADGDKSGSETREAGAGGVGAALQLLDYAVTATEDSATSRLGGLGGELTTPVGLGTTLDTQELLAAVTASDATGRLALDLSGLQLGLDELLPEDVLDALPLSVLLDLVDGLGLPLPAGLLSQVQDLEALPGTLADAIEAAGDLDALQDQVADLVADLPDLAGAQQAVTSAQATVTQLTSQISALNTQISGLTSQITSVQSQIDALPLISPLLPGLQTQLTQLTGERTTLQGQLGTLTTQLTSAQGVLAAAQAALDALLDQVDSLSPELAALLDQLTDLEGLLGRLLGQLDGLLDGLDLADLRVDLLDLLQGVPLLDLGELGIDLSTVADGAGSQGTATCTASGLVVLGSAVPTPTCAGIAGALDRLDSALADALAALPVAGALPTVDVGGLDVTSSGTGQPVEGISSAFARVTALTVDIAPAELTAVTDTLVPQLDGLLGQLTGLLDGLDLDGLDLGVLDVIPALAATGDAPTAAAIALPAGLDTALGQLQAVLDTLPTGAGLDGLTTVGLDAVLGAVDLTSTFTAAGAPTAPVTPATPGTPGSPTAPGTPAAPGGQLPRTGAGLHLLAMAALAALAAGATTVGVSTAVANGVHRTPLRSRGPRVW